MLEHTMVQVRSYLCFPPITGKLFTPPPPTTTPLICYPPQMSTPQRCTAAFVAKSPVEFDFITARMESRLFTSDSRCSCTGYLLPLWWVDFSWPSCCCAWSSGGQELQGEILTLRTGDNSFWEHWIGQAPMSVFHSVPRQDKFDQCFFFFWQR